MAKTLFRSPGVSTREIDLSAPGRITPQGIPAGVVGTSKTGPAFVPTVFATANEFINKFGDSEAKYFGAIAVKEWMRNARSGLFLRVLGVGNAKEANSANVTARSGFFVGDKIRNQSDITAESDGSAIARSVNPYAGAAILGGLDLKTATSGTKGVTAVAEISDVTISDDGSFALSEYDGLFITGSRQSGLKWAIFLSQDNTRSVSGTKIIDGAVTLHDFGSDYTGRIQIADLTSDASVEDIVDTIVALGGAVPDGSLAKSGSTIVRHTQTSVGAVATAVAVGKATGSSSLEARAVASVGTPGKDAVTAVQYVQSIEFDRVPLDDGTITLTDNGGRAHVIGFKSSGSVTGAQKTIDTSTYNTAALVARAVANWIGAGNEAGVANHAAQAINTAVETSGNADLTNIQVTYNASSDDNLVTIQEDHSVRSGYATNALTSMVVSEPTINAPGGRTMFLGCQMLPKDDSVDYFGSSNTVQTTGKKILRGVIMFASGVMPGLAVEDSSTWESSTASSTAFGEYHDTKDEGSHTGYLKEEKFVMLLNGFNETASGNSAYITGSFDPESPVYFSKVMNTDPSKLQERGHYLYANYDIPSGLAKFPAAAGAYVYLDAGTYNPHVSSASDLDAGFYNAADAYKPSFENWRQKFSHAFTPWITSQTLGSTKKKLFRFHMLDAGVGGHGKVKISIANITKSKDSSSSYGTFDVQIRSAADSDKDPIILEQHVGLSLNPSSDKYIARIIGDQNTFFEFEKAEGKQKLVTEGLYANRSLYVRIEVVDQIESGQMEASALPIGFQGKHHLVLDGDALVTHDLFEPPLPLRQSVSTGTGARLSVDPAFYWGAQSQDVRDASQRNKETKIVSLISNLTKWFPSTGTHAAWIGDNANAQDLNGATLDADLYNSNEFSMENIWVQCKKNGSGNPDTSLAVDATQWREALYIRNGNTNGYKPYDTGATSFYQAQEIVANNNKSKSAANGWRYLDVSKDFGENASKKYFKFTVPMQGGWDGLDIFDKDKSEMSNMSAFREMSSNTSGDLGGSQGPTTAAFRKAIDILAEKSDVDIQVLTTPGMRTAGITDYAIDKTEDRFDALYIVDMASFDNDQKVVKSDSQYVNVTNTVNEFAGRNLDTSFAAAYFPDIVIQDGEFNVVVPPSVGVLGALSLNDAVSHPWFAPAGQARGALSTVVETAVKLNRSNMDVLYEADINPITSFPNQGNTVMIYGQKTLLQAQSALDRVNVRRLLIDIRRKVRNVSNTILFEPNREATLARFSSLVNPILGRIQQQQGLDRFKVVIDTTTTTQQDIENNTIRGKIFLQPTRSIEFISLDFVVTNAGAEI